MGKKSNSSSSKHRSENPERDSERDHRSERSERLERGEEERNEHRSSVSRRSSNGNSQVGSLADLKSSSRHSRGTDVGSHASRRSSRHGGSRLDGDIFDHACDSLLGSATPPYNMALQERTHMNPAFEDDDDFDFRPKMMYSNQLQTITDRRTSASLRLDTEDDESPKETDAGAALVPQQTAVVEVDPREETELMKQVVQNTWKKADALRDQAVEAAEKRTEERVRKQIEDEKLMMHANFEERIKREVEEAKHVTWTAATRQQERAVEVALHEQNYTLDRTRQEVEDQRARVKEELGEAYHSIRKELLQDLQQQHSHNLNLAVQAAWDRATREKEQAVAAAIDHTKAEMQQDADDTLAGVRMTLKAELRNEVAKATQEAEAKYTEALATSKQSLQDLRAQIKDLKKDLELSKTAAIEAEQRAAQEQQRAVCEAVAAVEEMHKKLQEKALQCQAIELRAERDAAVNVAVRDTIENQSTDIRAPGPSYSYLSRAPNAEFDM